MFPNYHNFSGCKCLERTIKRFDVGINIPNNIYDNYCRYHFSVVQKLKSAEYHLERLKEISSRPGIAEYAFKNTSKFLFEINLSLDGFLYFCGSALDIFARDILTYYDLIPPPPNDVYFDKALDLITQNNPGNMIIPRLLNISWLDRFRNYRNCSTHEEMISSNFGVTIGLSATETTRSLQLKLPDDPKRYPRTYNRRDTILTVYCESTFKSILRLFNTIYIDLNDLVVMNGNLPLTP